MEKTDALFELIKSLDGNEKRYFTVFASQYGEGEKNNALKLFNAVGKQKKYDEKMLMKLLYGNRQDSKKYANTKQYLYKLVLKSMEVYCSEATVKTQLKSMLNHIEFLYEKGLYEQCNKMINKAYSIAEKYEQYPYLVELERCKLDIMRTNYYSGTSLMHLEQYYTNIFYWMERYKNNNEYRLLADKMFFQLKQKGLPRNKKDMQPYLTVMQSSLLAVDAKDLPYDASYSYHAINIVYHSVKNDFEKEYKYIQDTIAVMEAHPHQIIANPMTYLSALHNLVFCQFQLEKYTEVPESLQRIRSVNIKSRRVQKQIFYSANSLELKLYYRTAQFRQGILLVEKIKDKLTLADTVYIERQLEMIYYIAYMYFGAEEYNLANSWVNKIIHATGINIRSDLLCFAQLLQLIILFEKKDNRDLIEYKIKSVNRYFTKNKQLYALESILLDFFKKVLPKTFTKTEQKKALLILKKKLSKTLKSSVEQKALDYFDFISWIDSKIEGKTFAEVVRGKSMHL